MATTVRGVFVAAGKVTLVGSNNTKVRKFWLNLTGNSQWENFGEFKLLGDKCVLVDDIQAGQEVEVSFNINGRKTKYLDKVTGEEKVSFWQDLGAWKIEIIARTTAGMASIKPESFAKQEDEDDLPF